MPLYQVKCLACDSEQEIFRRISDYRDTPFCCGQQTQRIITVPNVIDDIKPYISTITGEVIGSRSKHKDHLKQHGCIEVFGEKLTKPKKERTRKEKDTLRKLIADLHDQKIKPNKANDFNINRTVMVD